MTQPNRPEDVPLHAVKFDGDKPRFDLLPWLALEDVARVMAYGAVKYEEYNYLKGMAWKRLARATIGHVVSFLCGEDNDKESGLPHLAHAASSALMLLETIKLNRGKDDRYKGFK